MPDLSGYFAYGFRDSRWGPSPWHEARPTSNGHGHPTPSRRARPVSRVEFSHDLSRVQPIDRRTPGDQARIDQAISYINDLARELGRGGGWETR
jgi:hypothetical protein